MIILLIMTFVIIALLEIPELVKKEYWRELVAFSILLVLSFVLSLLLVIGVELPSPSKGIEYIVKDLLHLSY